VDGQRPHTGLHHHPPLPVTRAGQARGIGPADLLRRVLELAGFADKAASANLAAADPR
jgi:hypothetical protein